MQAIVTRYHPPTSHRGSRISAQCAALKVWHEYDCGMNPDNNHREAAIKLCQRLGWTGTYYSGQVPNGDMVWVYSNTADGTRNFVL